MNRLGVDIRELGQALGRVIVRIEGQGTLDTVETLRRLAKARRAGDTSADRQLGAAVAALLVACDPILLSQSVQVMTETPATL